MKKFIVVLALVALPSTSSAGMFCESASYYGYKAGWANIACIMEIVNGILNGGYDYGFDRTNSTSGGDADDLGG